MAEQNYKELPYGELDAIERKYQKALDDISDMQQKIKVELVDIDNEMACVASPLANWHFCRQSLNFA